MIAGLHGFLQRGLKGDRAIFEDLNIRPLNALQDNRRFCQFSLQGSFADREMTANIINRTLAAWKQFSQSTSHSG